MQLIEVGGGQNDQNVASSYAGIDWAAVCAGGQELVAIPALVPQCDECQVYPTNRGELDKGSTREFYYRYGSCQCAVIERRFQITGCPWFRDCVCNALCSAPTMV